MLRLKRTSGHAHDVVTSKGTVQAAQVLLASGTRWIRRRIVPVGAFVIATEPLPAKTLNRLTPTRLNTVDTRNFVKYLRTSPDNRLLFGGRARFAASDPASDARSGEILRRDLAKVFPELVSVQIDYCWGGMVDMTRDRLPRAGERDGLFFSMGYSGHGTQMATFMGAAMAEVLGGKTQSNPWHGDAWPAIPGHYVRP